MWKCVTRMERTKHGDCKNVARTDMVGYVSPQFFRIIVVVMSDPWDFLRQQLNNYNAAIS